MFVWQRAPTRAPSEVVRALSSCQDCHRSFRAKPSLCFSQLAKPQKSSYWPPRTSWRRPFPPFTVLCKCVLLHITKIYPRALWRQKNSIHMRKDRDKASYSLWEHLYKSHSLIPPSLKKYFFCKFWICHISEKYLFVLFYEIARAEFIYLSFLIFSLCPLYRSSQNRHSPSFQHCH